MVQDRRLFYIMCLPAHSPTPSWRTTWSVSLLFLLTLNVFCQVDGVRYLVSAEEKIIITRHYGPFIASKYRKEKMKLMQLSTMGLHSSNGKNLKKIGFNY